MVKKPLVGQQNKSVDDKLEDIHQETEIATIQETAVDKTHIDKLQAMKRFGLVSPKKGSRVDIDHDLHNRFKIAAIKMNKTQKEWLEEIIEEAVLKAEKKLEKTI